MPSPNTGIPYVPEGTLDPAAGLNLAIDHIDALLQCAVISMALTAPPGGESNGDLYIVASPATGAWAGQENNLARYVTEGTFWQFFAAGSTVKLVLNFDDLGLYKWNPGSPGSWTFAAGLSDAPSDGSLYARRDGAWETFVGALTVQDTDSPPTVAVSPTEVIEFGEGLVLTEPAAGVAHVEVGPVAASPAPVVDTAAANLDATPANAGNYTRFSHAGPTYTFDGGEAYVVGDEYHGRYVGAGVLTITEAGGLTVNPPADGTLEIPPGGTFTVKIVASDEADLIGLTVPA